MSWISDIFGFGGGKLKQAMQEGAVIVDLRTAYEYDQGHIPRSLNIPIDRIRVNTVRIREMDRPVIVCGSSNAQCFEAASILRQAGIDRVYEGGSWQSLWKLQQK